MRRPCCRQLFQLQPVREEANSHEFKRSGKVAESLIRVTLARTYAHVDVKIFGRAAGTLSDAFPEVQIRTTARYGAL